jgi:ferric-dicitrate binding protein FerR (iron transport regulator)
MTQSEGAHRAAPGHSVGAARRYRTRTGIEIGLVYPAPSVPRSVTRPPRPALIRSRSRRRNRALALMLAVGGIAGAALAHLLGLMA